MQLWSVGAAARAPANAGGATARGRLANTGLIHDAIGRGLGRRQGQQMDVMGLPSSSGPAIQQQKRSLELRLLCTVAPQHCL